MTKLRNQIPFLISICLLSACASPDVPQGIPDFSMVMPDTTQVFHSKDIPFGKISMIVWFDPACGECQEETKQILANIQKLSNTEIYLVTHFPYKEMMPFYRHFKLDKFKNVTVGIDRNATLPKAFQIRTTPFTLIYNQDKILIAVIKGKASADQLNDIIGKNTSI